MYLARDLSELNQDTWTKIEALKEVSQGTCGTPYWLGAVANEPEKFSSSVIFDCKKNKHNLMSHKYMWIVKLLALPALQREDTVVTVVFETTQGINVGSDCVTWWN